MNIEKKKSNSFVKLSKIICRESFYLKLSKLTKDLYVYYMFMYK